MAFLYNQFKAFFTNTAPEEAPLEPNILDTKQQPETGKEKSPSSPISDLSSPLTDHRGDRRHEFTRAVSVEIQDIISAIQEALRDSSNPKTPEQDLQPETTSISHSNSSDMAKETLFPSDLVEDTLDLHMGAAQSINPLENPELREYNGHSIETVINELNEFAGPRGYCIVRRRSKRGADGQVSNVDLCCDRSRISESTINESTRKRRQTSTQRIECPWRCYLKRSNHSSIEGSSIWTLRLPKGQTEWRNHNHPTSETPAAHRYLRRTAFRGELGLEIQKFFRLRTLKPSDIYHTLHQLHQDAPITQADIYNLLHSWRRAQRKGMNPTQALIYELDQSPDWFVRWWPERAYPAAVFYP